MEHTNNKIVQETEPWFKNWFDSAHYHQLYANRDEKEAQHFIDALLAALQPANDASMIDVGCGAGRHSKYLASKGYNVTGIDTKPLTRQQNCIGKYYGKFNYFAAFEHSTDQGAVVQL